MNIFENCQRITLGFDEHGFVISITYASRPASELVCGSAAAAVLIMQANDVKHFDFVGGTLDCEVYEDFQGQASVYGFSV